MITQRRKRRVRKPILFYLFPRDAYYVPSASRVRQLLDGMVGLGSLEDARQVRPSCEEGQPLENSHPAHRLSLLLFRAPFSCRGEPVGCGLRAMLVRA